MDIVNSNGYVTTYTPPIVIQEIAVHTTDDEAHLDSSEIAQITSNTTKADDNTAQITYNTMKTDDNTAFRNEQGILNLATEQLIAQNITMNDDSAQRIEEVWTNNEQIWNELADGVDNIVGKVVTRAIDGAVEVTQIHVQDGDGTGGNITLHGDSNLF